MNIHLTLGFPRVSEEATGPHINRLQTKTDSEMKLLSVTQARSDSLVLLTL